MPIMPSDVCTISSQGSTTLRSRSNWAMYEWNAQDRVALYTGYKIPTDGTDSPCFEERTLILAYYNAGHR